MAINYQSKVDLQNLVDELFTTTAKSDAVVNDNFNFVGAKTVEVYNVSTVPLSDYTVAGVNRYGTPNELDATVQEMTMTQDRGFTFTIDKINQDETAGALEAASALARQLRERVVPEVDTYRFTVMEANAGNTKTLTLDETNIYGAILDATEALDDAEVPTDGRKIIVTPATYKFMKQSSDIILETEIGQDARNRGVVALLDGMEVIKVPASRFTNVNFGFMVAHDIATPAPVKLAEYKIHEDAPGISGSLVEGRVYYDAFVLSNKADAIYVHTNAI